jgi:DEAD/DEAH box helicase domain-containing protein
MPRISSREVLSSKGYSYIELVEPPSEPEYCKLKFSDVVSEFAKIELGEQRLYMHQCEALNHLRSGFNVVLTAGTGSGKTEAWILYVLGEIKSRGDFNVLALYPTLALANDQIRRIEKYMGLIGKQPIQIDSVRKEELVKKIGLSALRVAIGSSGVVITNPAFLLHDLKKYVTKPGSALLAPIYQKLDLLVIDELDFYGPRSLALLLGMIDVLAKISDRRLQVVVLSAGIANPEDLCAFLTRVTSRECKVVRGEPFRVENRTYIVLGKNIGHVWRSVREVWDKVVKEKPELAGYTGVVDDIEEFKRACYKIVSILESLGYNPPSLGVDPVEIIGEYLRDDYVTIVFTRSISSTEELVKAIKNRYGENAPVAAHHHLVPKRVREEVEEKARRGEIKVVVSPRTLSQGIDIGLVARVVHLGLPESVREYYQREGRKGRRRELKYSETIVLPYSRWDRELLTSGIETFRAWLDLGLEHTIINPDNLYKHLFTGVLKLLSPWFKRDLEEREVEALKRVGILTGENVVNRKRLQEVFEKMNFYEYAPPYGIKRYLEKNGELIPLEPIGHVDLVEKFQPGNIDYGEEAIVVALNYGKSSRVVRSVIEKSIREIDFKSYDPLAEALEEYRYIKLKWGETPNILKDLLSGRITSEELCVVYTPKEGFGRYIKIPERCIWTLRSERPKYTVVKGEPVVYYDKRTIYVPMPTGGEYRDFTYGYSYPVDPRESAELIRLGLAYIIVLLRRYFRIPLHVILYDVVKLGEYKYFALHEPESAGIIEKIEWLKLKDVIRCHNPDDLDRILISEIDDIAYSTLITIDFNWDLVREHALRVVDYILSREKIKALLRGREVLISKPSPALKLASYVIISEVLDEESIAPTLITAHGFYDGESFVGAVELYPPLPLVKPPQPLLQVESALLDKVFYEDFKVIVESKDATLMQLKQANLRRLVSHLTTSVEGVIDLSSLMEKAGLRSTSVEEIASTLNVEGEVEYARVLDVLRRVREYKRILDSERASILKYLEWKAKALYISYLVVNELIKNQQANSTYQS